jgi:hypothetical protein
MTPAPRPSFCAHVRSDSAQLTRARDREQCAIAEPVRKRTQRARILGPQNREHLLPVVRTERDNVVQLHRAILEHVEAPAELNDRYDTSRLANRPTGEPGHCRATS